MRRPGCFTSSIVLGALVAAGSAFAADTPSDTSAVKKVLHGGYLSFGGFLGDVGKLNDAVRARGYPGLKDYAYEFGFGSFSEHWRIVSALDFNATVWRATHGGNAATDLAGLTGTLDLGFNVLPLQSRFLLYPYLGAGLGMYGLELRDKHVNFDTVVAEPSSAHDVTMWQRVGALRAGVGFDYLAPRRNHPDHARMIGLRVGYVYDPSKASDWKMNEVKVQGGPTLAASGVYAQIVLGKTVRLPVRKSMGMGHCPMMKPSEPARPTEEPKPAPSDEQKTM